MRIASYFFYAVLVCALVFADTAFAADAAFQSWLQSLWPQAQELGVSRATFDTATRGLEPDLSLPELVLPGRPEQATPGQAEFVQTPADYLKETSIERLAAEGRKFLDQYRAQLTGDRASVWRSTNDPARDFRTRNRLWTLARLAQRYPRPGDSSVFRQTQG